MGTCKKKSPRDTLMKTRPVSILEFGSGKTSMLLGYFGKVENITKYERYPNCLSRTEYGLYEIKAPGIQPEDGSGVFPDAD